jgi:hypothetical protein
MAELIHSSIFSRCGYHVVPARPEGVHVFLSISHIMRSLKQACVTTSQVAAAAFVPSGPPRNLPGFDGNESGSHSRHALRPMDDATVDGRRGHVPHGRMWPVPHGQRGGGPATAAPYQDAVNSSRTRGALHRVTLLARPRARSTRTPTEH